MIAMQLFDTLAYLHRTNIVHRDVKPENILMQFGRSNNNIHIKLIDFGFAAYCNYCPGLSESAAAADNQIGRHLPNRKSSTGGVGSWYQDNSQSSKHKVNKKLTEILGSPLYMAPEIVRK